MKIISWNVNGLRSCAKKGFSEWLDTCGADIVGLQEVRALPKQLPPEVASPQGWNVHFSPAERLGYSGVGLYSRQKPDELSIELGSPEHDVEGRLQLARFGSLVLANGYFPNGNGKNRDNSRIPFKLDFYARLFDLLEPLKNAGVPVLVMGDFNTAHKEIDLARPKANVKISGFRPEERAEIDRWVEAGWVDTFRHFDDRAEQYSWWSNRAGARERNVGWRIDMVMASPGAMDFLKGAFIHQHVTGSDHCPIGVEVDEAILSAGVEIPAEADLWRQVG